MDGYNVIKNEISQINEDLCLLFSETDAIPGLDGHSFAAWKKTCRAIRDQIAEEILRVAVVGAIKSGKSTFANALFKGDYLKRGAGVVTSIVTKVRKGRHLKATLLFKSWNEVNSDIQQALVLFPPFSDGREAETFDIRRSEDRSNLEQALADLGPELLIKDGNLNANTILLSCYVKGYESVQDIISSENRTLRYADQDFEAHTAFVGDDTLAVYLKDLRLEINTDGLAENIEIADCQGSDSPNPLHLAMIQDYLTRTHLIVYVISSRTGIRQADIKFLSIIRKMGILDNILFVVNTDFSEHESVDDLKALVERVTAEVSSIRPQPEIFAFSALYNLFTAQPESLSEKDSRRLAQWKREKAFTDFSTAETSRFETAFHNILTGERFTLLLKNHLERLDVISSGMARWVRLNQDILSGDIQGAMTMMERIKGHQEQIDQVKSLINSTLTGAVLKEKQALKSDIDRLFSNRSSEVVGATIDFIRNYRVPHDTYERYLKSSGFSHTLYMVFQEFRQALDAFMAENVNPAIIRFVKDKEHKIAENLKAAVDPYHAMVRSVLAGYDGMMDGFDKNFSEGVPQQAEMPDMDAIKRFLELSLPPVVASMRYSARVKTDAALHLGFYTVIGVVKKIFNKSVQNQDGEKINALQDGVKRIKRETEKAVVFHFKNYRENLKFQYIYKLVDAVSRAVYDMLVVRFQVYAADLTHLAGLLGDQDKERESALEILDKMARTSRMLEDRVQRAKQQMVLTTQNTGEGVRWGEPCKNHRCGQ